jgi:hypothetical protein
MIHVSEETMEFRRLSPEFGICQATRRTLDGPGPWQMISIVPRPIFFNSRFNLSLAWPSLAKTSSSYGHMTD